MFGALLFVGYFLVGGFFVRRYFLRKHGVTLRSGDSGGHFTAYLVGFIWPAMFFLPALREPELCTHYNHVRQRAQIRSEIETYERILREEKG